jgi:outer membrane protein assembly factor BamB
MSKARDLANAGTALTTVSATELGYLDGVTSNVQTQINTKDSLPSRSGQTGKYLTNNGTDASWGTVSQYALPTQTGNAGKFLTTNGTSESWASTVPDYSASSFFQKIAFQNTDDNTQYGGNSTSDGIVDIVKDSSGNFFIAGNTYITSSFIQVTFLIKKDSAGNTLWQKAYTANTTYSSRGVQIVRLFMDSSGDLIFVGTSWNGGTSGSQTYHNAVMKLSKTDGSIVWSSRVSSQGEYDSLNAAHQDSSGNIYAVGNVTIGSQNYGYIQKWDNSGAFQWARRFTGESTGYTNNLNAVTTDSSGNVYVTGEEGSSTYGASLKIAKLSSSGTTVWQYFYNISGSSSEYGRAITLDASGNIYVGVNTPTYASGLVKLDANGTITWSRFFGTGGGISRVVYHPDGYLLVTGSHRVALGSQGADAGKFGKLDLNGNILSQFIISSHPTFSTDFNVFEDTNHYYLFGGIPNQSNSDGFFAKVKKDLSELGQYTFNGALLNFKNAGLTAGTGQTFTRFNGQGFGTAQTSGSTNTYPIAFDGIMASSTLYI